MTDRPIYAEGICGDGAAILKDGVMMPIENVVAELNRAADLLQCKAVLSYELERRKMLQQEEIELKSERVQILDRLASLEEEESRLLGKRRGETPKEGGEITDLCPAAHAAQEVLEAIKGIDRPELIAQAAISAVAIEVVLSKYQYTDWRMADIIMTEMNAVVEELERANG